ncbi:MAG: hypothetical protein JWO53_1107, partial [Chlamydiia bacterium]|nr:hypothetical protein [Chlamydiia bacterium]
MVNINTELSVAEYHDECSISAEPFKELIERNELVTTHCGHKYS